MSQAKTLLEIVKLDLAHGGHRGPITLAVLREWFAANPVYCHDDGRPRDLDTRYYSGSMLPIRPLSHLDRATRAWLAASRPAPSSPDFDRDAFDSYLATYLDEHDWSFYQ